MLQFQLNDSAAAFGHHFIVGLSGTHLNDLDKRILSELRPGGILLFKRNFNAHLPYADWLAELQTLLEEAHAYSEREKMIVSIDHEGGRVVRTPPPITHFPATLRYRERAAEVATAMAVELKSIGVNLSWSPSADIQSNPKNPVIGDRSFGTTATSVSDAAVSFLRALEREGVMGCAKHFPGHGDTHVDSHFELPELDLQEEQVRARELVPFQALIDAGVSAIMSAHIRFSNIDTLYPATLSEAILRTLLRDQMGFKGVLVSDDLGMKAIEPLFEKPYTMGRAFTAGCDLFIVGRNPQVQSDHCVTLGRQVYRSLLQEKVTEEALRESFNRVETFFEKISVSQVSTLNESLIAKHQALAGELIQS